MPLSAATHGHGSKLEINTGSGFAFVAEIDDIPELPTGNERQLYNTSNFDTVEFEEFKKLPLKDGVAIEIMGNYVINSASDDVLQAADDAEGALPYRITLFEADNTYLVTGTGLFYNLRRRNPKDSKRTFSITLKPVDKPAINLSTPTP